MDDHKPRKSRRQTKAEARRALRDRRHGLSAVDSDDDSAGSAGGAGRGQLAGLDFEEEDAFETMDEVAYQRHVAERMEREDFVVDDGAFLLYCLERFGIFACFEPFYGGCAIFRREAY